MPKANFLKRFISLSLITCILIASLQFNKAVDFHSIITKAAELPLSPSETDHSIRVSYRVEPIIYADYESDKTAKIVFALNHQSNQKVSFEYAIYSGSAKEYLHFEKRCYLLLYNFYLLLYNLFIACSCFSPKKINSFIY